MNGTMTADTPMVERRNPALRARRDAIAGWFGIHPFELANVAVDVLEVMQRRIEAADEHPRAVSRQGRR